MRNLAKGLVVLAICLALAAGVWARGGPRPGPPGGGPVQSIALVSVPQTPLHFGLVSGPGPKRLRAELTARVLANRPFQLGASFRGLSQEVCAADIPAKDLTVTINGREVPVGTEFAVIAAGGPTPGDGVDVPVVIEVGVKGTVLYPAGRYGGNLVLAIR